MREIKDTLWIVEYRYQGEGIGLQKEMIVRKTRREARELVKEWKEVEKMDGWRDSYKISKYVKA